jgi:hypothetical protein
MFILPLIITLCAGYVLGHSVKGIIRGLDEEKPGVVGGHVVAAIVSLTTTLLAFNATLVELGVF